MIASHREAGQPFIPPRLTLWPWRTTAERPRLWLSCLPCRTFEDDAKAAFLDKPTSTCQHDDKNPAKASQVDVCAAVIIHLPLMR